MLSILKSLFRQSARQTTINELSKLSDHELRDIGICRGEIQSIALEADAKRAELYEPSKHYMRGRRHVNAQATYQCNFTIVNPCRYHWGHYVPKRFTLSNIRKLLCVLTLKKKTIG